MSRLFRWSVCPWEKKCQPPSTAKHQHHQVLQTEPMVMSLYLGPQLSLKRADDWSNPIESRADSHFLGEAPIPDAASLTRAPQVYRRPPMWSAAIHSITVSTEDFSGAVRSNQALFSKCILRGRYSDRQQVNFSPILGIRGYLFIIFYIFQYLLCNYNNQTNKINMCIMVIISDQYWRGSLTWWLNASWLSQLPLPNLDQDANCLCTSVSSSAKWR